MASTAFENGRRPKLRPKLNVRAVALAITASLVLLIAACAVAKCTDRAGEEARDAGAGQAEQPQVGEQGGAAVDGQTNASEHPADAGEAPSGAVGPAAAAATDPPAVCPVIFADAYEESARHNAWGDGWTLVSARDTAEEAAQVLKTLQTDGWDLVFASTLDLAGQAWGCVAFHEQRQETLLAYMVPRVVGRASAAENPLVISIVRVDHAS